MVYYSDLDFKMTKKKGTNDTSPVVDEDAINQSLFSLFNTEKGERLFNPTYGVRFKGLLFEPLDRTTAQSLVDEIKNALSTWENTRVKLKELEVNINYDYAQYEITLDYQILNTSDSGQFTLILKKV